MFAGLPGVGKSYLSRLVADRLAAVWLRVDTVEAAVLKAGVIRSFETGLAAYLAVRDVAAEQLRLGRIVVIDAVNGVESGRKLWRELARESNARLSVVEVTCSDRAEHQRRVEERAVPTPPLPPPTWEEVVHREYEPWKEPVLSVDSIAPAEESVQRILAYCSRPVRSHR